MGGGGGETTGLMIVTHEAYIGDVLQCDESRMHKAQSGYNSMYASYTCQLSE
jgi:hypothetical protein